MLYFGRGIRGYGSISIHHHDSFSVQSSIAGAAPPGEVARIVGKHYVAFLYYLLRSLVCFFNIASLGILVAKLRSLVCCGGEQMRSGSFRLDAEKALQFSAGYPRSSSSGHSFRFFGRSSVASNSIHSRRSIDKHSQRHLNNGTKGKVDEHNNESVNHDLDG